MLTAIYSNCLDVVLNYIALDVIGNIDEIYYGQIRTNLKEELEERGLEIPIRNFEKLGI